MIVVSYSFIVSSLFRGIHVEPVPTIHCLYEPFGARIESASGSRLDRSSQLVPLVLAERTEDVFGQIRRRRRRPHPDPEPRVLVRPRGVADRFEPLVPAGASPRPEPDRAERQVDVIADNQDLR